MCEKSLPQSELCPEVTGQSHMCLMVVIPLSLQRGRAHGSGSPKETACNTRTKTLGICPREPGIASSALAVPRPRLPNHLCRALLNSAGLCGFDVPLIGFICHGEGFRALILRGELTLPVPGSCSSGPRGTQPGTVPTVAGVCQPARATSSSSASHSQMQTLVFCSNNTSWISP